MKDAAGNEIHEGAILKVFHYIGDRGRREYMYKQVGKYDQNETSLKIFHLNGGGSYFISQRAVLNNCVVVQCLCDYHIYNSLKRHKKFGG